MKKLSQFAEEISSYIYVDVVQGIRPLYTAIAYCKANTICPKDQFDIGVAHAKELLNKRKFI
jgi:hypothetical protein